MADSAQQPLVGVIMGSQSDYATMQHAAKVLTDFGVPFEMRVVSAHRTPDRLREYARSAEDRGIQVIIAGAGGAAHLPGMAAAQTTLPVLGVPIESKALRGMDSLLSIVQMPPGVPVGTLAIGESGAKNAALFAISILANNNPTLSALLQAWRDEQSGSVAEFPIEALDVGKVVASGKTKIFFASTTNPYAAYAYSKDIVTWKDKYQMRMEEKGIWSNTVSCNLFELFERGGLHTAYLEPVDRRTFMTELCDMLPFEVVAVGVVDADSSYRKRNPMVAPETVLPEPEVLFFLKTSGKTYKGRALPCDDPLMVLRDSGVYVYEPGKPLAEQTPIFGVSWEEAESEFPGIEHRQEITTITRKAFRLAHSAYIRVGGTLYDGKWEYGIARRPEIRGKLLMADVFDADSMRLTVNGKRADKQIIRNGGEKTAPEQREAYILAAQVSGMLS